MVTSSKRAYPIPRSTAPRAPAPQQSTADPYLLRRHPNTGIPQEYINKLMLKILQSRLQQYTNHEIPDVEAGLRKGRGTRDQTANIHWIIKKAGEFQKNIYFCCIDYAKTFDCVDRNKL